MKKPREQEVEALKGLVHSAVNGTAEWFSEILAESGFLQVSSVRGKDLARLAGVTPGAVSKWYSRDGCPRNKDGTYRLADVVRWILESRKEEMTDPDKPPADPLRRKHYFDAKRKEMEYQIAKRELIPREEFRDMMAGRIIAVGHALDAAPDTLAPKCAGRTALEIRDEIRRYNNSIRDAFAEGLEGDL